MGIQPKLTRWHTARVRAARCALLIASVFVLTSCSGESEAPVSEVRFGGVSYPLALDPQCRDGSARIYDECSDQLELFEQALARANAEHKVLLVSLGAEWCIWCHVFESHIAGNVERFRYTYGSPENPEERDTATLDERADRDVRPEAKQLTTFVAANFVLVHIEIEHAPNGFEVLDRTASREHFPNGVPFIFTVDRDGQYAAHLDPDAAETRRDGLVDWYRGYNRVELLEALSSMRDAALL